MDDRQSVLSDGEDATSISSVDLERGGQSLAVAMKANNAAEARGSGGRTYGASKIWTLYNEKAKTHDNVLVTRINSSMDSILIFAGLFSAVVTAFLIESYQSLNQDPTDVASFYLAQLASEVAQLSGRAAIGPPSQPPPFSVDAQSVAVNILWALSLIASLACALGATLIQSWTTRYQRVVSQSPDVVTRARDRAWYFDGLKQSQMEAFASGVPAVLHLSLFLFLAGLVVFLFPVNHQVAYSAMGAAIGCGAIYAVFIVLDLFVSNSPYQTPFSVAVGFMLTAILVIGFLALVGGVTLAVLGLVLAGFIVMLPFLAVIFIWLGGKTLREEWRDLTSRDTTKLPKAGAWSRYRKHAFQKTQVYNRIMGTPPGNPKQDVKALQWLLEQTTTVTELELFVDGIEVFIEQCLNKPQYAKMVLELGGHDVGTFSAGLGLCIGHLLESCAHSGSEELPLEHRRSRTVSTTRALISIFTHTGSAERIQPIGVANMTPTIVKTILEEDDLPSTRWIEWIDISLWETIASLQHDSDPTIAHHTAYLSCLILHRALSDVAFRIETREVEIYAPENWFITDILSAIQHGGDERLELYELAVTIMLLPHLDERPAGYVVSYTLPEAKPPVSGKKERAGRPIRVSFSKDKTQGGDGVDETEAKLVLVTHDTFKNEATLLALATLLDHVSAGAPVTHADVLARVLSAIAKGSNAKNTHAQLQHDLIQVIQQHHTTPGHSRHAGGSSTSLRALTTRSTVPNIFHLKEAVDDLVSLVETMEEPECLQDAQVVLAQIRKSRPADARHKFQNRKMRPSMQIAVDAEREKRSVVVREIDLMGSSANQRMAENEKHGLSEYPSGSSTTS
ncbi:hypothetical protein EIP91_004942 [Steccherinum ochraceum]|uniref:DUF6535 domain-containing protein n=1 Tax=Steccherinum ochraceum TaxID=92696 RepID=A0A4R0R7X3_9APHY|nr:hypothetical protein EIP91_004942 [Steccherinum ochraceum]